MTSERIVANKELSTLETQKYDSSVDRFKDTLHYVIGGNKANDDI